MASNLFLLLAALAFVGQSNAFLGFGPGKTSVLLDSEFAQDGSIGAHQICGPSANNEIGQIIRVNTIIWLSNNIEALVTDAETTDQKRCLSDYIAPIRQLNGILEASRPDACSYKHISLVEEFHRAHIEPQLMKYKSPVDGQKAVPEPLKWFFIYYATGISRRCRQNFLDNLDLMAESSDAEHNALTSGSSGRVINAMRVLFDSPEAIEKEEDFLLIWNMVERYSRKKGITAQVSELGFGDPNIVRLKMRSPSELKQLQMKCNQLRVIYQETALSLMRLIDMGYKIKSDAESPAVDNRFKNWYAIAQTCEYLLPMHLYEDSSLEPEAMVIISEEEANQLTEASEVAVAEQVSFTKKPAANIDDFVLDTKAEQNPLKLLKEVRSNLKSRMKVFRKVFKKLARKLVSKAQLKKLLISRKSEDGKRFIQTSAEPLVNEALSEVESEENSANRVEIDGSLERHVRDVGSQKKFIPSWLKTLAREHPAGLGVSIFIAVCVIIAIVVVMCVG